MYPLIYFPPMVQILVQIFLYGYDKTIIEYYNQDNATDIVKI